MKRKHLESSSFINHLDVFEHLCKTIMIQAFQSCFVAHLISSYTIYIITLYYIMYYYIILCNYDCLTVHFPTYKNKRMKE